MDAKSSEEQVFTMSSSRPVAGDRRREAFESDVSHLHAARPGRQTAELAVASRHGRPIGLYYSVRYHSSLAVVEFFPPSATASLRRQQQSQQRALRYSAPGPSPITAEMRALTLSRSSSGTSQTM